MKRKSNLPQDFSPFIWGIALFCVPVLFWPLALLISPSLSKNPQLNDSQLMLFSILLWGYPVIILILARLAYRLHQYRVALGKKALFLSYLFFYILMSYTIYTAFIA